MSKRAADAADTNVIAAGGSSSKHKKTLEDDLRGFVSAAWTESALEGLKVAALLALARFSSPFNLSQCQLCHQLFARFLHSGFC